MEGIDSQMGSVESVDYVDYVSAAYRLPVGYDPTEDKNTSVRARIMPFAEAECSLFMGILLQSGSCCRRVSGLRFACKTLQYAGTEFGGMRAEKM